MTVKVKPFAEISSCGVGSAIPLKYNGKVIGKCIIGEKNITLCADKCEDVLARALREPGLTGFSIEVRK